MKSVNGQWKLVGLVSLGEEHQSMQKIFSGNWEKFYFYNISTCEFQMGLACKDPV